MHLKFQIKGDRHGNRPVMLAWSPRDDLLAVATHTQVTLYNKDGSKIDTISSENSTILDIMWSPEGKYLAILCLGSQLVRIWNAANKSLIKLMLDVTDPTCMSWNKLERQLVVGTGQGHVFTYDPHTTKRVPQMSKHVRRLVSICHTLRGHRIASLSADSLILSDCDGNTHATLKQKTISSLFLGKVIPVEILIEGNECIDAVVVPIYFHPSIARKTHNDYQLPYEPGYKLIVVSAAPDMWSPDITDGRSFFTAVANAIDGCAVLDLPQMGSETLIDIIYCQPCGSLPPSVLVMYSNGHVVRLSLDRSKIGFCLSTDTHRTRFGSIMWERNIGKGSLSGATGNYNSYIEDMNNLLNLQDNLCGMNGMSEFVLKGVSTCHGIGFLDCLSGGEKLILPVERGFTTVNLSNPVQETPYLAFHKNATFPGVTGYPVNIAHSAFNRGLCAVACSNGTVNVIATINVVLWQVNVPQNPVGVCYLSTKEGIEAEAKTETGGGNAGAVKDVVQECKRLSTFCLSLSSPMVASLSFVMASPAAPPKVFKIPTFIELKSEPAAFALSEDAIAYLSEKTIYYSPLALVGTDLTQLAFTPSWKVAMPVGKPTQFDILSFGADSTGIVSLSQEGALEVHHKSCAVLSISDTESLKFQVCSCCSPFIYAVTFTGVLMVYSVCEADGRLEFTQIATQQLPAEYASNAAKSSANDSIALKLSPGGTICAVYKVGEHVRPCFYLPAENVLIDQARYARIAGKQDAERSFESVPLLFRDDLGAVYNVAFDALLSDTFVLTTCTKTGSDYTLQHSYVCTIHHSLPEQEGYGILAIKAPIGTSSGAQLPAIIAGGIGFALDGAELRQRDYVQGLQSFAASLAFYTSSSSAETSIKLLGRDTDGAAHQGEASRDFSSYYNYLAPLQDAVLQYTGQELDGIPFAIHSIFPRFRSVKAVGLLQTYEKAAIELASLGHTRLAFVLAIVTGNTDILKFVADSAVRVTDLNTALLAYRELSLYGSTDEYASTNLGIYKDPTFLQSRGKLEPNNLVYNLSTPNTTHNNDPAALSLFLSRGCMNEYDNNTSMALALLIACPDLLASETEGAAMAFAIEQNKADAYLNAAERLLLKSRRPNMALSFRMDSLDWNTASMLATKIGSTAVRSEILTQWAGELENRLQYPECLDACISILTGDDRPGAEREEQRLLWNTVPPKLVPFLVGLISRCYAQLGKISDLRDLALPLRKEDTHRFVPRAKDPLNILQRSRLCMECGDILCTQKRFADAALFLEAAANLAETCYARLKSEIAGLLSGELNIYSYIYSSADTNMMRVGTGHGSAMNLQARATKPLLLFNLLPTLLTSIANSILITNSSDDNLSIDIYAVREIDTTLNVTATKKLLSELLPTRLQAIIQEKDLKDLDPPTLLSRAVGCYIKSRQYAEAERLIEHVTDVNIVADLARVYMKDDPNKALILFKRAGRSREIVDCLVALGRIAEAESAVKETKLLFERAQTGEHTDLTAYELEMELKGASGSLAAYHRSAGNIKKAIFFSILSGSYDDAFELAIQSNNEDLLVRFVTARAPPEFLKKAVRYFTTPVVQTNPDTNPLGDEPEKVAQPTQAPRNIRAAAHFLELLGEHNAGIKVLLHYGNGSTDIDQALSLLKSCKQSVSTIELVLKYLNGELDGCKRPPIYVFKFYMAMEKYADAARTAYLLADREIEAGRYSKAKSVLIQCVSKLRTQAHYVPTKFRDLLILLHGLDAGKMFSKAGLHTQAAMCLYRVSKLASRFGDNAINILLPATVECSRAGPRYASEAYECACTLLKEYSDKIPEKYKKPVEQVVRKHKKGETVEYEYRSCCSCGENVVLGALNCENCMAVLPLDSSTGAQMTLADYCECPSCLWTCSKLGFTDLYKEEELKEGATCLMCGAQINVEHPFVVTEQNFTKITDEVSGFEDQLVKPLLMYENGQLAQRRYEQWTRIWQSLDN